VVVNGHKRVGHQLPFALITLALLLQAFTGCGGGGGNSGGGPPPPPSNPIPAINSLNPNAATAGGDAFTLSISGYNFVSSSSAQWNGSARSTTYISADQLQIQINSNDIANSGSAVVTVTSPAPGGGNSGNAEFTINPVSNPVPAIQAINPSSIPTGSSDFILTISGSNFIPGSTVEWSGEALSTSYLSDTQLEAQVPGAFLIDPGSVNLVIQNPVPGGGSSSPSVFTITYAPLVVSQLANDLVWDGSHQLIYMSVPSLATSNGNSVLALNPMTGSIDSSQFAGSEPDVLAISDDGQFLYAGIDGSSSVQRFSLPDLSPDLDYSLGADPTFGPYFAVDLSVAPGLPHTTAVSRGDFVVSTVAVGGMAIYDDDTRRPTVAKSNGSLYDSLQWGSDSKVYAINNEISSFDFYVLTVDANGVKQASDYKQEFSRFYVRMHYDAGSPYVYTDDGYVINPTNGARVGRFQASGYMVPDSTLNRAFFLGQTQGQQGSSNFTIESFDLTTFSPVAELVIPNVQGNPLRFIRWGTSGLAFNDDAGFVYLINNPFVGGHDNRERPASSLSPVQRSWQTPRATVHGSHRPDVRLNRAPGARPRSFSPQDSNPMPTIAALSPSAVVAGQVGSDGFTLTVSGADFVSLSRIEWNGSPCQTEFVSATQLQCQISAADVESSGAAVINVMTPAPGGGTSNALSFSIVSEGVYPRPAIFSLYPPSTPAGSAGFTLAVNGQWLEPSSIVEWDGTPRQTTYSGNLQIQLSAEDLAAPGDAHVTVFTPGPGGGLSNTVDFQILYQPVAVNQATNDLVWDPLNQVFYVSIPGSATTNANQVCVLNPATTAITKCQAGSEPDVLALSDDSQFLYVGMDGNSTVQRYVLPALTPDLSYSLGSAGGEGPYFALDLQVAPGSPHTTAVSLGTQTSPQATGGITIYDDSTPRPVSVPGFGPTLDLYDSLQWGTNSAELYAANTEGGGDFYSLSVNASGITLNQDYPSVFWNPGRIHLDTDNGYIYSDDGFHVIDPATGLPVGIVELGGGWPLTPDSSLNTIFALTQYLWQIESPNYTIDLFDISHYTPIGRIPFSTTAQLGVNPLLRFVRWGSDGLAANFGGDKVYLLSGSFVGGNGEHQTRHGGKMPALAASRRK